jgi:hypothetical protein
MNAIFIPLFVVCFGAPKISKRVVLSRSASIFISRNSGRNRKVPSLSVTLRVQNVSVSIDPRRISGCASLSEWENINPGLVVAYCLMHVFSAKFPRSDEPSEEKKEEEAFAAVEAYNSKNVTSTSAAAPFYEERFNAYGIVRTLAGDVDAWYYEVKHALTPGALTSSGGGGGDMHQLAKKLSGSGGNGGNVGGGLDLHISLSKAPISFHYVSQVEAMLLYRILSRAWVPTLKEMHDAWPSVPAKIGHYSRGIADEVEARRVWEYLVSTAKVYTDTCNV